MTDARPKRADGVALLGIIVGGIALLLLLYVASVGPMIALCDGGHGAGRCDSFESALRLFYTPIIWLHEETPLERALDWYVDLWGG